MHCLRARDDPAGNADSRSLGGAILAALSQSTHSVPWPADWKKVTEPLLLAAKAKTWSAFARRATNARVDRTSQEVSVRRCLRDKASFVGLPDKVTRLTAPDAASVGAVVAASLSVNHQAS